MPVLFQFAVDDGPIELYDVWKRPIGETLDLIEWFLKHTIVCFNIAFDHFQLVKTYTVFRLCPRDWIPEEHIDEIALKEPEGQEGPCIKPLHCLDLMLHSRKGPYQSLMAREDIRIRRVPTALAYALAAVLEERIEIDGIYFAKSHDKDAPRWQVFDVKDAEGNLSKDFKDVCLRFNPAGGLKFLAEHALGYQPKYHFQDVELDRKYLPKELGYAPTALAVSNPKRRWEVYRKDKKTKEAVVCGHAWPGVIRHHIEHWATNGPAREYAEDDIKYTRELYVHFGRPPSDDDDSVLACMVPVVRWRGYQINVSGIQLLLDKAQAVIDASPININKHKDVRRYIGECLDDTEKATIATSANKKILEKIRDLPEWDIAEDEICTKCDGKGSHTDGHCRRCAGSGTVKKGKHPASARARELLLVKAAMKEVELYRKLLRAGKFHASFIVVGALSSRMSGADGLNAQGIKKTVLVRSMFPLASDGYELSIGDFASFEVTIADAVYNDPDLRKALLSGKKLHALIAMCMFEGKTYEEIIESDGAEDDLYTKGKQGTFALTYGGDWSTLVRNLGLSDEDAKRTFETWGKWFPQSAKARERTFKKFCSMTQPGGIGTAVVWADPAEYIETFMGFRRYYTLENMITKALFDLSRSVPKEWKECKVKVLRRDRVQTAGGAVSSALYGAAFQIQAANQRSASNHEIQSVGAQVTKAVQRKLWDLQPTGIHDLLLMPANVHDEIICPHVPQLREQVAETVYSGVEHFRGQIPLIGMDWVKGAGSWADKKEGPNMLKIRSPEMMATAT